MSSDDKVTISDVGRALDAIASELVDLLAQQRRLQAKIDALRTQGQMLNHLVKLL